MEVQDYLELIDVSAQYFLVPVLELQMQFGAASQKEYDPAHSNKSFAR